MICPSAWLAQVNAAPTLTFLNEHITWVRGERKRIPSGVAHERFMVDGPAQVTAERAALLERCGLPNAEDVCIILMVQVRHLPRSAQICPYMPRSAHICPDFPSSMTFSSLLSRVRIILACVCSRFFNSRTMNSIWGTPRS